MLCLTCDRQSKKHIQEQPGELNVVQALKMLNSKSFERSRLCRNIRLRTRSYLAGLPTTVSVFTIAEATTIQKAVMEQMEAVPATLPAECIPRLAPDTGSGNAQRTASYIDLN